LLPPPQGLRLPPEFPPPGSFHAIWINALSEESIEGGSADPRRRDAGF
jgi:hypothetical protein